MSEAQRKLHGAGSKPGKVWLVGAGPGDPELLTIKAQRALQAADVVLHDDLVSAEVLALVPATAEVRYVGKRSADHEKGRDIAVRQEEINFLLVEHAKAGKQVVRLKSGDPLVFGRLAEEMEALREAGVAFEIVPGVTSAFGAAAAAQIPMTHRRASSAVVFVTAQTAQGREGADWTRFAGADTTVVVYMPGRDRAGIAQRLIAAGNPLHTPCAMISQATTPQQRVYATTLAGLHRAPDLPAPTLLVIGEVVTLGNVESYLPEVAEAQGWWDGAAEAAEPMADITKSPQGQALALPSDIFFSTVLGGYQTFDPSRVNFWNEQTGDAAGAAVGDAVWSEATPIGGAGASVGPGWELGDFTFIPPADAERWDAEQVLEWAFARFGERVAISTAFGAEGMVTIDLAARLRPRFFRLFTIDTEFLFPETYELMDRIEQRYGVKVERAMPEQSPQAQEDAYGAALWMRDADRCCELRKVEPLRRKLGELDAWVTNVRRDQTASRATAKKISWDAKYGLVKINPLADWTKERVWEYIRANHVPYNVLHDRNYPSIGCTNCTRAILPGEDERAGRWPHLEKTECGLHVIGPAQ